MIQKKNNRVFILKYEFENTRNPFKCKFYILPFLILIGCHFFQNKLIILINNSNVIF